MRLRYVVGSSVSFTSNGRGKTLTAWAVLYLAGGLAARRAVRLRRVAARLTCRPMHRNWLFAGPERGGQMDGPRAHGLQPHKRRPAQRRRALRASTPSLIDA